MKTQLTKKDPATYDTAKFKALGEAGIKTAYNQLPAADKVTPAAALVEFKKMAKVAFIEFQQKKGGDSVVATEKTRLDGLSDEDLCKEADKLQVIY